MLVVVNARASGSTDAEALLARSTRMVSAAGARATGVITESEGELAAAVGRADGRRVAVVGGDGSLHAAVNLPLPLPELAMIPAGRANNVARALSIPSDPDAAARVAARCAARPVDLLRVTTGDTSLLCVEGLSAGLQAAARQNYTRDDSSDLVSGVRALLAAVRDYRPYRLELHAEGRPVFRGWAAQAFLANLPLFGFGFRVNPQARPADGRLEAVVLRADTRRQAVARLLAVYRGSHVEREWTAMRRVTEARIGSPLPLAGDSRPLGTTTAAVRIVPDRLRLAAP